MPLKNHKETESKKEPTLEDYRRLGEELSKGIKTGDKIYIHYLPISYPVITDSPLNK